MRRVLTYTIAGLFVVALYAPAAWAQTSSSSTSPYSGSGSSTSQKGNTPPASSNMNQSQKGNTSSGTSNMSESQKTGKMSSQAGSKGIRQAQQELKAAGFDPGPIDGKMGTKTSQALKDFQQSKGLQANGKLDKQTRQALGSKASS